MSRIPGEQTKTINGAVTVVPINPDYIYTQVTIYGRNAGIVTATVRPKLEDNDPAQFHIDDFEGIEGGAIDLGANPRKRTFTIETKRCSALRFADAGVGAAKAYIHQWGRASA